MYEWGTVVPQKFRDACNCELKQMVKLHSITAQWKYAMKPIT